MDFGFNLLIIVFVVVVPASIIILIISAICKDSILARYVFSFWGISIFLIISFAIITFIAKPFFEKKQLDRNDFYGEYIVDRDFFSGKNADWQYNHFRFEIKENDTLYLYATNEEKILKTYTSKVKFLENYNSCRLAIEADSLSHHIIADHPCVYREVWGFYLVFHSKHYNNMFFRKGKWKKID